MAMGGSEVNDAINMKGGGWLGVIEPYKQQRYTHDEMAEDDEVHQSCSTKY